MEIKVGFQVITQLSNTSIFTSIVYASIVPRLFEIWSSSPPWHRPRWNANFKTTLVEDMSCHPFCTWICGDYCLTLHLVTQLQELAGKLCVTCSPTHYLSPTRTDSVSKKLVLAAPNLGPLISRWEINKFENCWYKSVRILEVLKLLFQQFLNLSSSQRDMRGPIIGD